ncbi:aldehyde dehydrogenase family protein [Nocardioides marmoriginsengisoli]|uniref:Aldehyde dehydrogenase family protein n=1 Tax=Nocardioides marmoriginsengisoli TaxID=661483 RepID=A0A3N0CIW6_9ACTN|nr:aldehyde dehydrogenase family protein [Nocardioides marmoriginsengisoli]
MIGGDAVASDNSYAVIDPVTGAEFARAPECSLEQLDSAMESAHQAQHAWAKDEDGRREAMRRFADAIDARAEELTSTLVRETGKPHALAATEPGTCSAWLRYYADVDIPRERMREDADGGRVDVIHRPLGVVAAITPWNFPLVLGMWKIAPAVRAGNAVVLKPSPYTPLSTLLLGEIAAEVLPPGILNVVSGGDDLGRAMTAHPRPRKVTFTGSIAGGKNVAVSAAADLKRYTLELGGNDAAIVLDDADLAASAAGIVGTAFLNSGQACALPKRVFVPRNRYDDAVAAFAEVAQAMAFGMSTSDDRTFGPLSTGPQFTRVKSLLAEALDRGALPAVGGIERADLGGYFVEPTLLTNVDDTFAIVQEEQFGPVLPVLAYDTLDEAIDRANNTMYGLAGSVWGADVERAADVAERVEAGAVWVNGHAALAMTVPFGGMKWSGVGVENGVGGLLEYTDAQSIYFPATA